MKERPILFIAPMVRAILAGTKSQTRRLVKPQPEAGVGLGFLIPQPNESGSCAHFHHVDARGIHSKDLTVHCPYGMPGGHLWVREAWQYYDWTEEGQPCIRFAADNETTWPEPGTDVWADKLVDIWASLSRDENYSIDNRAADRRWRPSIHMPRWASRITLEITGVRVERLQDISEADAIAEGVPEDGEPCHRCGGAAAYMRGGDIVCCEEPGCGDGAVDDYHKLWESINGRGSWDANPWVWVVEFAPIKPEPK